MTATVRVDLGARGYDVSVGRAILHEVGAVATGLDGARRAVIVTQPRVARHYADPVRAALAGAGLEVHTAVVDDGEQAKSLATLGRLYTELARLPLGRRDVVVALGGGVVGDLAGFLAATWHRGVAVIQVPTTLLAQVDAAVGGKTAINLTEGKNLVGAFHQPVAVVADVATLATLPPRELAAGLAEVAKYGLIRDPTILELLEADPDAALAGDPDLLGELVRRSVAVKAAVVAADEREADERAHLNLGHTYGHAVEAVTGYRRYLHGEAVALGTCVALRLGCLLDLTPRQLVDRAEAVLDRLGLPTRAPQLDRAAVWAAMGRDKKAVGGPRLDEIVGDAAQEGRGGVTFVLLEGLARCTLRTPPAGAVDAAIDEIEARRT
ncbi:MAG: 3-dehydroquinate synthase [Actinobacteria bacterium]|nr:3-dehydroquinate synthase [Actinomycetota bacterium]